MELLINGLLKQGARRDRLEAKIFGGAKTIARFSNVGEQNAAFARQFLLDEGIRIVGESTGGEHGRKLEYWPSSGRARQYALTGVETQRTVQMEERPIIAAVYLNRMRIRMPLQADPTVQYAIQLQTGARKPRLIFADYRLKSPYNTYLVPGLPPGPVGNPGRKSIEAVVSPASVPYLYFVATGDGRHTFSRTYGEHLRAIARSRRK